MCAHAWCLVDVVEFAGLGESSIPARLSLLQTGSGSVCPWHLRPDPSNAHQPPKVPDSTAETRALYLHSQHCMWLQMSN